MTKINIATNIKNIVGIEIEKPFEEIRFQDVVSLVKATFPDEKRIAVLGWAFISETYKGYKLKPPNEFGYFEAEDLKDCDAYVLHSHSLEDLKTEIDENE